MLNPYYLQELRHLRDIAREFSKENPAIAPMLEEPSSDPDVERLLEGVAFLTGAIRQKLDDEIPEIIHDLLRQTWPQALRPLPSATLVAFSPEKQLSETCRIHAGIQVNSLPVSGTVCPFRTCDALDLHPVSIRMITAENPPGGHPLIRISFRLHNQPVSRFRPSRLRLHLGGRYAEAADLYLLLTRNLKNIRIRAKGDTTACVLGPECLSPGGFCPGRPTPLTATA
jgi:type VI secretion system protein ImpG